MIPHWSPVVEFWGWVFWFAGAGEKQTCCARESNEFEVGWGEGNELGGRAKEDPEREKIGSIKAGPYRGK